MNTTDQQTTTNPTADPKGDQLKRELQHLTLEKMIEQLKNEDLSFDQLCNALHKCCQLKKADAAEEKIHATERIAIRRLNKTNPPPPNTPGNPETNSLSPRLCRGSDNQSSQPGDLDHPNTNPTKQSHADFCRNLARAAMDIWGVDISDVTQPGKKNSPTSSPTTHSIDENPPHSPSPNPAHTSLPLRDPQENNAAESQDLYDIPPQYRRGATPIKGSQEKYGQPKYTHKEWRKAMHQAIRANYGIHDEQQSTPKPDHPHQSDPAPNRLPPREHNPAATQPDALDTDPRLTKDAQPRPPP